MRPKCCRIVAIALSLFVFPPVAYAQNIFRGDTSSQICEEYENTSLRQTVVYIDLLSIQENDTEWGLAIINKIPLTPREKITIIPIDTHRGQLEKEFVTCYPALTEKEIEGQDERRNLIDKMFSFDPAEQNKENIDLFTIKLKNFLNYVYSEAQKISEKKVEYNAFDVISFDSRRFQGDRIENRVIVFSDLSDEFTRSLSNGQAHRVKISDQFDAHPIDFNGSDVSIYGLSNDIADNLPTIEAGYTLYLQKQKARLRSIGPTLPFDNSIPATNIFNYDGQFSADGVILGSHMLRVYSSDSGNITKTELQVNTNIDELWVPLITDGNCSTEDCDFVAKVEQDVPLLSVAPYFRSGDKFVVDISRKKGELRPVSVERFSQTDTEVKYEFAFN
jgi:hypothetical protein